MPKTSLGIQSIWPLIHQTVLLGYFAEVEHCTPFIWVEEKYTIYNEALCRNIFTFKC